jgi:membrane-bound serine protease (ClpP class)
MARWSQARLRWNGPLLAALLLAGGVFAQQLAGQEQAARDGLFITVPHPLDDSGLKQINEKIKKAVLNQRRPIQTIVFDFNPNGQPAGTSSFNVCASLADYIRDLPRGQAKDLPGFQSKTIAFVHNQVTNHTVLPVLACGQIVMSQEVDAATKLPKAKIGDVLHKDDAPLKKRERETYDEYAATKASPDLVLRMIDRELPLRQVKTPEGTFYASPAHIEQWKKAGKTVVVKAEIPSGLEPGQASFDAVRAREFGLCSSFSDTRADLAESLRLPPHSLGEDWLVGKSVVPWRIDVTGALDRGRLESLERRIHTAIGRNANFLILHLNASGGETTHVASLAEKIRTLRDKSDSYPVRTVAYIPPGVSLGAASYLALACNEIVMGKDAVLANFNYLKDDAPEAMKARREMMLPLAKAQGYPAPLLLATLDPKLVLYRVQSRTDAAEKRILSEDDFKLDQQSATPHWDAMGRIAAPPGETLKINADLAREWRLAYATDIDTAEKLYALHGLEPDRVRVSRDDLLDRVAEFFREPIVNFILIMLGIIGLILELKMPGTTFPGAIAAICFVLFFWSYSFVGEFTLLAILLFLLGLILIAVEIFLVPGLGFSGVAGVALLILSLALVTLERWPETSQDWTSAGRTVSSLAFNRLILTPPEEDAADGSSSVTGSAYTSLLGAIGFSVTALRPAGKVQIGDQFYDVIAEGDFITPGRQVIVVEVEGNRIVVQAVT